MNIKTLVLCGEGINCEKETADAFELAGSQVEVMHIQDFLGLMDLNEYDILAFPGGFSYGDEIRSGKIIAELILSHQQENLNQFIKNNKSIIGICNGFQILMELGVFNHQDKKLSLSLNQSEKFINTWTKLNIVNQNSFWVQNLNEQLFMPARHKEGRIQGDLNSEHIVLRYNNEINGSKDNAAAITNSQGNILGIMPHPEAATYPFLLPHSKELAEFNIQIFKNAIEHAKRNRL